MQHGKDVTITCIVFAAVISCGAAWSSTCGRPHINPDVTGAYVIGGHDAQPNSWPWMLALLAKVDDPDLGPSDFYFICGASLIHTRWAVTAAHCIAQGAEYSYGVGLGYHVVGDNKQPHTYDMDVAQVYIHPQFDPSVPQQYDLALLRLEKDITLDESVQNVCLPSPGHVWAPDTLFYVTGWGAMDRGTDEEGDKVLQQLAVPMISPTVCGGIDYYWHRFRSDIMLCAGYEQGQRDACQGDSGGPLVTRLDGQWVLAGVVSFGDGCALPKAPGVYTHVASFMAWINATMATTQ